jgi:hypothetical protein
MNGTHHTDPIRQAFLTRDVHNVRSAKEAVFDHRKIELITQRLIEQLVRPCLLNLFILCTGNSTKLIMIVKNT